MELIKKNILLFSVLGITLIVSIALLVFVLIAHGEMMVSMEKIEAIKKDISDLQRQKPVPHKTNMTRINKDSEAYKVELQNIYHYFGQPYRDAMLAFVGALGMSEEAFMTKFREFWTQNAIRGSNVQQLFIKFSREFDTFKFNKAKEVFRQVYQKQTLEKVNDTNLNDILLYIIGANRPMSPLAAKTFITVMQDEMIALLKNNNIRAGEGVYTFTFGRYANEMPRIDEINHIVENMTIIGDIFTRIAASGIKQVDSIARGPLEGTVDGKFLRYRYTLEVTSETEQIFAFINNLADAFKSNRIYIIRNMTLEKTFDRTIEYTNEGLPSARILPTTREVLPGENPEGQPVKPKEVEKPKKPAKKVPFNEERSYGKTLIGASKQVKMLVEFDYVIFIREKFTIQE